MNIACLTFSDEADAQAFVERTGRCSDPNMGDVFPTDLSFVLVDADATYAPISRCVAAGAPPWDAPDMKPVKPFKFGFQSGGLRHSVMVGPAGAGKSVPEDLLKLLACGHPGGTISVAQAGFSGMPDARAKRATRHNLARYYHQFDERK